MNDECGSEGIINSNARIFLFFTEMIEGCTVNYGMAELLLAGLFVILVLNRVKLSVFSAGLP